MNIKVGTHNYFESFEKVPKSEISDTISAVHALIVDTTQSGENWDDAMGEDDLREGFETQFATIEAILKTLKAKGKKTRAKRTPKKKVKEWEAPPGKAGNEPTEEQAMMRRFFNLIGKEKTKKQVRNVLNALQRSIVKKRIRKTSEWADLVRYVQKYLIDILEDLSSAADDAVAIVKAPTKKWMNQLDALLNSQYILPSVRLISRYVGMQNKLVDKEKAERFMNAIDRAFLKKQVRSRDPYYQQLQKIRENLSLLVLDTDHDSGVLTIEPGELNGLQGILESCGCDSTPTQRPISRPRLRSKIANGDEPIGLDELLEMPINDSFRLSGAMGELLGELEQNECAITIKGAEGSGKSTFLLQLADAFANDGFKVAVFTLETARNTGKFRSLAERTISPKNRPMVKVLNTIAPDLTDMDKYADDYDVVLIDSYGKADLPNWAVDYLRKNYPNTIWGMIFQETVSGSMRGGARMKFDSDVNVEIFKPDATFRNNYALCTKNRFGETGQRYYIASRRIKS